MAVLRARWFNTSRILVCVAPRLDSSLRVFSSVEISSFHSDYKGDFSSLPINSCCIPLNFFISNVMIPVYLQKLSSIFLKPFVVEEFMTSLGSAFQSVAARIVM